MGANRAINWLNNFEMVGNPEKLQPPAQLRY